MRYFWDWIRKTFNKMNISTAKWRGITALRYTCIAAHFRLIQRPVETALLGSREGNNYPRGGKFTLGDPNLTGLEQCATKSCQRQEQTKSPHFGRTTERSGGADTVRDVQTPQACGLSPSCAGGAGLERGAQRGRRQRGVECDGAVGVPVGGGHRAS